MKDLDGGPADVASLNRTPEDEARLRTAAATLATWKGGLGRKP